MVTKGSLRFLRSDKRGYEYRSQYYRRLRLQCLQDIKDLTEVAEGLEEKQQRRIFTRENLKPLVEAILKGDTPRHHDIAHLFFNQGLIRLEELVPVEFYGMVLNYTTSINSVFLSLVRKKREGELNRNAT